MKKFFPLLLAVLLTPFLFAANAPEIPAVEFVKIMRNPLGRETWGKLSGTVFHKRRGGKNMEHPITFNVIFTGSSTIAKLVYEKNEIYTLTQSYLPPYASSLEQTGEKSTLNDVGLRPGDLTMDFIFWDFVGETDKKDIRGLSCRSLLFRNKKTGAEVRVFAAADHAFPVRVEWINPKEPEGKPFRTLEVNAFRKVSELWTVEEIAVSGPGWRTLIKFDTFDAGFNKDGVPADLL